MPAARPMHDLVLVAVGKGGEDVRRDALQLIEVHRRLASGVQLLEVMSKVAGAQLQHEVYRRSRHHDTVKLDNVGVPQRAQYRSFTQQCDWNALIVWAG